MPRINIAQMPSTKFDLILFRKFIRNLVLIVKKEKKNGNVPNFIEKKKSGKIY